MAALTLVTATIQLLVAAPARALAVPPGFQLVDYPTGQAPYNLTDFAWLPNRPADQRQERHRHLRAGRGLAARGRHDPRCARRGDHGMLGFALANDYATTGRVYLCYDKGSTAGPGVGMVEEWTASPADNPTTLTRARSSSTAPHLAPLAQTSQYHGLDTVLVAPDDTLYVTLGDDTAIGDPKSLRAQDTTLPYGKLLHLTPDGQGSRPTRSTRRPRPARGVVVSMPTACATRSASPWTPHGHAVRR